MRISGNSTRKRARFWKCPRLNTRVSVSDRQERILGWDQHALAGSTGLFIGAGGIDGLICEGMVRKGLGIAHIVDFDVVTPSNLNRQKFVKRSLYKNKAIELCRLLSKQGFLGTQLIAHPFSFQDLDLDRLHAQPDFVVCGVDNQLPETRLEVCRFCHKRRIPGVFIAVSTDADAGYVLVQVPDGACWACVLKPEFARSDEEAETRCPGEPACMDVLLTVAGPALYAIDTLLMQRKRNWNYLYMSLSRPDGGASALAERRPDCPVCGSGSGDNT